MFGMKCSGVSFLEEYIGSMTLAEDQHLRLHSAGTTASLICLVANRGVSNASKWKLGIANNGGGTDGAEFTLPAVALNEGDALYVLYSTANLSPIYGITAPSNQIAAHSDVLKFSGNDAIELFYNDGTGDVLVDVMGESSYSGTPAWLFTDGHMSRASTEMLPKDTYNSSDWVSEPGAFNGGGGNSSATPPLVLPTISGNNVPSAEIDAQTILDAIATIRAELNIIEAEVS